MPDPAGVNDPFAVQVEITSRCNLACPSCPLTSEQTASSLRPGHMNDDVWSTVLGVARTAGHVYLSGFGESLTHPRCLDVLGDLDAAAIPTTFVTNGLALSRRKAARLVALPHLVHVNVSVDSPDPEVFVRVRGGRLEHALRGLAALMAAGADPARVSVSTLLGRDNSDSLVAMPELLARAGVRHWVVQGVVDYNEHSRTQRLPGGAGTAALVQRLREASERHGIEVTLTAPDRLDLELSDGAVADRSYFALAPPSSPDEPAAPSRTCLVPWELPYVDKDGAVHACCFSAGHGDAPLGDLTRQSFDEVWTGPQYASVRTSLVTGRDLRPSCLACTAVPWGPHPLATLSAAPVGAPHAGGGEVTVRYRNTGRRAWKRDDDVRLGTARPRDGASPLAQPGWLSENRPATHSEPVVPPGGTATFVFPVAAQPTVVAQHLELVADGTCWLPGTRAVVAVGPDAGPPVSLRDRVRTAVSRWRRATAGVAGTERTTGADAGRAGRRH